MKKPIILFQVAFFLCLVIGLAQENNEIEAPNEKIEVNKEFDEDGNLIRYDSVYSYSSGKWNHDELKMDSIMKRFFTDRESIPLRDPFEMPDFIFPQVFPRHFGGMDSIFMERFEDHQQHFDSILKRYRPKKERAPQNQR